MTPPLLTIKQTALQLAVSVNTAQRLIARGEIASVQIGSGERKLRRIPPEAIDAYIRRLKELQTPQGVHR